MEGKWKIKELHELSVWNNKEMFEDYGINRNIIKIEDQVDVDGGEYIAAKITFEPDENDPAGVLNTPFYICGMILEEI